MIEAIAVRNLPTVDETVELWDRHDYVPNKWAFGNGQACLLDILAIDKGYIKGSSSYYEYVQNAYGISYHEAQSMERGFMGEDRQEVYAPEYYDYGQAVAERVL